MLKERKIFNLVIKKNHNEFFMTNKDDEDFENSTKFCFCFCFFFTYYVDRDVRVWDHFHVIGKRRDLANRDCNIKLK